MAEITATVDVRADGYTVQASGPSWPDVACAASAIVLLLRDAESAEKETPVEPSGSGGIESQLTEIIELLRRIERSVATASVLSLRPNSDRIRPGI